jgi:hypothetical protein
MCGGEGDLKKIHNTFCGFATFSSPAFINGQKAFEGNE